MKFERIARLFLAVGLILAVPLVAMQFTDEVDWKLLDFIIAGTLLISAGLLYEFLASRITESKYRTIIAFVIIGAVLLIWAELAVGVFGSPFAGS